MSFRYPLDNFTLTQGFGGNAAYYKQYGQNGHNGLDLGAPTGTPVYAADEGTVVFEGWGKSGVAGYAGWMGNPAGISILINHVGSYGGYAHLSRTVINAGDKVTKGQLIGYVGATGAATGPHLHFEMLPLSPNFKNGYAGRIDPTPYIDTTKTATIEQVKQAYRDILEREADQGGIDNYIKYTIDFVRSDLANSQEKRNLDARKAEATRVAAQKAAEDAAKALADAEKAKEIKAAEEALKKAEADRLVAEAEVARIAKEERLAREAAEKKAKEQETISKENKEKLMATTQETLSEQTASVLSANEYTPFISENIKTIAYFSTDIIAVISGLIFTLLAIFGVLDAIISVTVNTAITTALLGLKQTFRLTSKKQ